jgi:peptidyl-prolyl cis-trans isomerase D
LAGGIIIPETLIVQEFKKENQTKTIKYINLEKYHSNSKPAEEDIKKLYERNKNIFFIEFKSIQYAEIKPNLVSGSSNYDETFFKQLDVIENQVLDGKSFDETIKDNNLKKVKIDKINLKKEDQNKNKINSIPDDLFNKIYNIKSTKSPEVINLEGKYYLAEISSIERKNKLIDDPEVQEALKAQLSFKDKIEKNSSIAKDIGLGAYDGDNFKKFADDNNLEIKNYNLSSLKQNDIFGEGLVKRIFLTKDKETNLITNSTLTKTFLIFTEKTKYKKLDKSSNDYEKYEAKARLNLINKIYKTYDDSINQKYKVELNQRTIDRVKNSF